MRKSLFSITVAGLALSASQPVVAQGDVDQQLGSVHFKTSCNEVAQRRFDRGMRYQHSFWYLNAKEIFEQAIEADPTCAMAYWGIALTLMDNPHAAIPQPNLAPGLAAITKAREVGAPTERERDYIDALMVMYTDYDKIPHAQRMRALARRPGAGCSEISGRRRSSDRLRHHAQRLGGSERQDLRPADQGRRDPGTDFQTAAAAPRRDALFDPPLRLSVDRT